MGYTHYWYQSPTVHAEPHVWDALLSDVREIILNTTVPIRFECDSPLPAELGDEVIRFNGVGSQGHETFEIERRPAPRPRHDGAVGRAFNFCKTAQKPYDIVVCAVLIAASRHLGALIDISSDGGNEDWEHARLLCRSAGLAYAEKFKLKVEEIDE